MRIGRSRKVWYAVATVAALSAASLIPVASASATTIPANTGSVPLSATKSFSGTFDGGMKRYYGTGDLGSGGQDEGQDPLFDMPNGGTLKNVILGSPAADGVHCARAPARWRTSGGRTWARTPPPSNRPPRRRR